MGFVFEFLHNFANKLKRPSGRMTGNFDHRMRGLFELIPLIEDKFVLDVGCHYGLILYELSKLNPRLIHGIEGNRKAYNIAKSIFHYVSIESHFFMIDLRNIQKVRQILLEKYDVILYLAVDQHIRKSSNDLLADQLLECLCERCTESMLVKTSNPYKQRISSLMARQGFDLVNAAALAEHNPILRFDRHQATQVGTRPDSK